MEDLEFLKIVEEGLKRILELQAEHNEKMDIINDNFNKMIYARNNKIEKDLQKILGKL
ncbi:hypothetical protein [Clostridium lacusfryxellense]|uniref:hypothetical protein n=1 Tax=Clostridium lacusfryxellense TaxID=205328 RepID=UPI001C0D4092|nr:hypothetical protein [Clostridium lacusfryxellense]MBU3112134.1 hypothetical protein [Clostridium lacusfryxellense]